MPGRDSPTRGRSAALQIKVWPSFTPPGSNNPTGLHDPTAIKLADGQLITVAFVPSGASIPKPSLDHRHADRPRRLGHEQPVDHRADPTPTTRADRRPRATTTPTTATTKPASTATTATTLPSPTRTTATTKPTSTATTKP